MDMLRERLISKIDEILAQVVSNDTPPNTQLQIEAKIVLPQDPASLNRPIIIDYIDIDDFKCQIGSVNGTPNSTQKHANAAPKIPLLIDTITSGNVASTTERRAMLDAIHPAASGTISIAQPAPAFLDSTTDAVNLSGLDDHLTVERTPSTTLQFKMGRGPDGNDRAFPKRRKQDSGHGHKTEQLAVDKLIEGIWEQIHNPNNLAPGDDLEETQRWVLEESSNASGRFTSTDLDFSDATKRCRQITTSSRTTRAIEVIVQAHWIDCYDTRLTSLNQDRPGVRPQEHKKTVLTEACTAFSWSEKELRNRMAIWKGYRELKNAAGWCALIFAGPGIYRFCKYRLGFDDNAMEKLQSLRPRVEVAADTLQPQWRQMLSLVGEPTQIQWQGHPHDWTVSKKKGDDPLPLAITYKQWDTNFTYKNLEESIVDKDKWGEADPRRFEEGPNFYCKSCFQRQSSIAEENECECFPDLYSPNDRTPTPVQVFRTDNGKNNGLLACCSFKRGQAVGEFIGMITKGLADVDVMQSQAGNNESYQIWQGKCGNFTRFMNHSCASNCQFQTFSWLGVQRIVVVSKGVTAGEEITVDYSGRYWDNLDKICLCGEPCCRYKESRSPASA